ncbi:hypothetical protein L873DRAFT_1828911 [Choiromyces venosus 120613-1]|uniref:Uncharacterized protein n=1 Tax=Choiromyces venosus 120613-1 TaxID=1336337 RepID=A0A3N4JHE7_9PEZI|nr:hypothetical protein L873DRAFT_1828911 [Choiromyces venosus 120613-1]
MPALGGFIQQALLIALTTLLASASAHGVIVSPPRRAPGPAMKAVCGSTIYNNQAADAAGPVELLLQSASSIVDARACNLFLCKGYQFDDNVNNVQSFALGETVNMQVQIIAPHTGYANVSIVDTKSNTIKGSELISWDNYASTSTGVTADETNFSIVIPQDLAGCAPPAECVIQWFWFAPPGVQQTYEGCVDFVIGGGSSKPVSSTAAPVATTSVVATTAPVEATAPAETTTLSLPTTTPTLPTAQPTTFKTRTHPATTAPSSPCFSSPSSTCSTDGNAYNRCMDEINKCLETINRGGATTTRAECETRRSACKMC